MYKTAALAGGCFLLVGVTLWGLIDVINRPTLYLPSRAQPYGTSCFLSLPRYSSGGFSLAKDTDGVLKPFPDRSSHVQGLIGNAVDIHLDSNGLLWVLDSGVVDTLRKPVKLNEPRILSFDADTGKSHQVISLKELVKGRAQYLCVEENAKGPQYFYVSDGPARSIVVWDLKADRGHRVVLPHRVEAHPVQSKVLYIILVQDTLYLTYFGSMELFSIETKSLRSGGKVVVVGRKDPRMIFLGSHKSKLVFRLAGQNEVLSWDTTTTLGQDNFELVDRGNAHFNQMAAVPNFGKLWILDSDVKTFLEGKQPKHVFRPASSNSTSSSDKESLPELKTV